MTITRAGFLVSGPSRLFDWEFQARVQHPASDFEVVFTNDVLTPLEATPAQTRAAIVKQVQDLVSNGILVNVHPPSTAGAHLGRSALARLRRRRFGAASRSPGGTTRRDQPRRIHRLSDTWCCHHPTDHSALGCPGDRSITSRCGEHRRHHHLEQAIGSAVREM